MKYDSELCVELLREKQRSLQENGVSRFPSRGDFSAEEVCAIKAFLGPWPRALEAAGLKRPPEESRHDRTVVKRIRAKQERNAERKRSSRIKTYTTFSEDLHKQGTGVSNKLILENLLRLSGKCDIIVRIPVIGGFNDDKAELEKTAKFLKQVKCIKKEPLPYHSMGEHKYDALEMKNKKYSVPCKDKMNEIKKMLED